MNYINNDVKQRIIETPKGTVILLKSPTGSGKSYFFETEYLVNKQLRQERVLMVVNRAALRNQTIQALLQKNGLHDELREYISDQVIALDTVTVVTYQYLSWRLMSLDDCPPDTPKNEDADSDRKEFPMRFDLDHINAVVFDECHFFLADAMFNVRIDAFKNIPSFFSGATRIYVSATIEPVRDIIFQIEHIEDLWATEEGHRMYPYYRYTMAPEEIMKKILPFPFGERKCLELTGVEEDYSYLIPHTIEDNNQTLIKDIIGRKNDGTLKKALLFVSNKENGIEIAEALKKNNISAAFIFSEKDSKYMDMDSRREEENLISREKFDSDVLLATTKIDNGVNIKDSDVTHVYPYGFDPISIKQQVGRLRRINDVYRVHLVLRQPCMEALNRKREYLRNTLTVLQSYDRASSDKDRNMILLDSDFNFRAISTHTFERRDGRRKVSCFTFQAMEYQIKELSLAMAALNNNPEYGVIALWLEWFGLEYNPDGDECRREREDAKQKVLDLITAHTEHLMDREEYNTFRDTFKRLYLSAFPVADITNGRQDRIPGIGKMNELLSAYRCKLVSAGTGRHILKRIGEEIG